ncbi:MAG: hypothetical protein IT429_25520 [Gemmataceae bacterium]|nr:hypothetical protein [Gemmataceae bacterium]
MASAKVRTPVRCPGVHDAGPAGVSGEPIVTLRVGPFDYRVFEVEGLIWFEGRQCLGFCDNDEHVILVARHGCRAQRQQVLWHEYLEAWVFHFGQDRLDYRGHDGKEAVCDLYGLAMAQVMRDLQDGTLDLETLLRGEP